jgi:hypothetical protein
MFVLWLLIPLGALLSTYWGIPPLFDKQTYKFILSYLQSYQPTTDNISELLMFDLGVI